jgi:hypothetical protein
VRYLLLQHVEPGTADVGPVTTWAPDDLVDHISYQQELNRTLEELGELVDAQGLAGPEEAIEVTSNGSGPPEVTAALGRLLVGYRLVEVASLERAIEIAALVSKAQGPGGRPLGQPVEVRLALEVPEPP